MKWYGIPRSQLALNNMAMQARLSEKGELVANRDGTLSNIFLWNMIGAICLLPALAFWLLPRQRRTSWMGKKL